MIVFLHLLPPSSPVYVLLEYIGEGNLRDYLRKHGTSVGFSTLESYCVQVLDAVGYLQDRNIVHRDIAARNVLVANEASVKLSDFGRSYLIYFDCVCCCCALCLCRSIDAC